MFTATPGRMRQFTTAGARTSLTWGTPARGGPCCPDQGATVLVTPRGW